MMEYSFFTTLQAGWFNVWIPAFGMVFIQFVYMAIYRDVGHRAVDTSWYSPQDKLNASVCTLLQSLLLLLSMFVPFKVGTAWFVVGAVVFALSFAAFIYSFHCYGAAPMNRLVEVGIYRLSRNPMYFFFFAGMMGVCIASASLWMLLVLVPFALFMHLTVLGEERYCTETYGDSYLQYKERTPRYFLFF